MIEEGAVGFAFLQRHSQPPAIVDDEEVILGTVCKRAVVCHSNRVSGVLRRVRQWPTISSADADIFDRLEEAVRAHSRTWTCWLGPWRLAGPNIPPPIKLKLDSRPSNLPQNIAWVAIDPGFDV